MRRSRRQVLIRTVQWLSLAVVVVDLVIRLVLVAPLRQLAAGEREERDVAGGGFLEEGSRVEVLRKFQAALPDVNNEIKAFLRDHVPSRRRGFSRAARLVRRLSEQSGLQLDTVSYRMSSSRDEPLEFLRISVTVEGPFRGLFKFAHALGAGSAFGMCHDLAFQPAERNNLALRLGADLYLEP